jgi:hypothetical protein
MQAFHNDKKIQDKYLGRVRAHAKADEIIKGQHWQDGKGCAVGCTIHSGNHLAYETELGIPQWLAKLEDRIFDGLPNEMAKEFPIEFIEAINIGADLNKIKIPMLIFIVESALEKTNNVEALSVIDGVLISLRRDVLDITKLREAHAIDAAAAAALAAAAAAAGAVTHAAAAAIAAGAREDEYKKFADKLLQLIRGCNG